MAAMESRSPRCWLVSSDSVCGVFNAMGHRVTQHVLKCWRHTLHYTPVHLNGSTNNVELYLLARIFGGLAYYGIEPV